MREAITKNEDKKELVENELEKLAGGKLHRALPQKDLSDEDRKNVRELLNDRSGYIYRRRTSPNLIATQDP